MKDEITLEQAFKLLGLEEVSYDPWGNGLAYLRWLYHMKLDDISHDSLGFWIHVRTCGTLYLAWTYFVTAQHTIDFHSMRGNLLLFIKEHGMLIEELIQKLIPKEERWRKLLDYTKPLPPAYIGHLWMHTEYPLRQFISDTRCNILGRLAGEEFHRRTKTYPELGSVVGCIIGHSPYYKQEAIDRSLPIPNKDEESLKLWDYAERTMKGKISVGGIKSEYDSDDIGQDKAESIIAELRKAGGDNHKAVLERDKILASALDGKLGGYLNGVTMHDIQDITGRIRKRKEKESLETEMDAGREAEGIEVNASFLDTIPSPEPMREEPIDLEELGFNVDELTPKELLLLGELRDAVDKGYKRDSKQGLSLRQYWDKDYDRKMKMLKRLEAKQKKP